MLGHQFLPHKLPTDLKLTKENPLTCEIKISKSATPKSNKPEATQRRNQVLCSLCPQAAWVLKSGLFPFPQLPPLLLKLQFVLSADCISTTILNFPHIEYHQLHMV